MIQKRRLVMWAFAGAGIAAFVLGASAQEVVRAISQAVVTPADPIWAQDPGAADTAGGRYTRRTMPRQAAAIREAEAERAAAATSVQPGHHGQRKDRRWQSSRSIGSTTRSIYEIPKKELGKDFLWVNQVKRTVNGSGYGGQAAGNRVVRWELYNNRVLLKVIDYSVVADPSTPIAKAVEAANNPSIMRSYNVAAFSPNGDPVIDVTQLFTTEVPELSVRGQINGGRGFDAARTFIEKVVSFPENINVEVTQTFTAPLDAGAAAGAIPRRAGRGRGNSFTVLTSYSMVKLPEKPMMGRLFDERVGYFSQSMYDYSRDEHRAEQRTFITRYRLEKKDPDCRNFRAREADRLLHRSGDTDKMDSLSSRKASRTGSRHSKLRDSAMRSSRGKRRRTIRTGARKTRAIRWFAGCPQQRRTPRARTSTTRDRARFSKRTFSSTTTFKTSRRTGTSCRSEHSIRAPRSFRFPTT